MKTNRTNVMCISGICAAACICSSGPVAQASVSEPTASHKPNIVFILTDDLGWRDSTVYGSTFYETPNLERLAQRGMMFHNAYAANPLCSPTRASILTGQFPARLRLTTPACHLPRVILNPVVPDRDQPDHKVVVPQSRTRLPLEYYTLAEALRDAGYSTAHFGKWHLGNTPYQPEDQGFDFNLPGGSYPGPPGGYFAPFRAPILKDSPAGEHIDDRLAREAVQWIKRQTDQPFFLNFWFFSVHSPHMGKDELVARYRTKADPNNPQRNPIMGAMIETMDRCVGQLLDAIDASGQADNTIIVFTSDNGGVSWMDLEGAPVTSNLPLRNGKASIYEGGTREPLIVVWPGHTAPGSRSDVLVSSIDYYPTLLDMAALRPKPDVLLDGVSIVPALQGRRFERDTLFCHFPHYVPKSGNLPSVWVRQGHWKLIRFFGDGPDFADRFELYNLKDDVGETRDLASAMPEKVRALDTLITRHLSETKALVPKPNPSYHPGHQDGWVGNKDAAVSYDDQHMMIKPLGQDPFVVTRSLPPVKGPFTLEFQMSSRECNHVRVFWSTVEKTKFNRERSTAFAMQTDDNWHVYQVTLPVQESLKALRFDPEGFTGEVRVRAIRLRDDGGNVSKEWIFNQDSHR